MKRKRKNSKRTFHWRKNQIDRGGGGDRGVEPGQVLQGAAGAGGGGGEGPCVAASLKICLLIDLGL